MSTELVAIQSSIRLNCGRTFSMPFNASVLIGTVAAKKFSLAKQLSTLIFLVIPFIET